MKHTTVQSNCIQRHSNKKNALNLTFLLEIQELFEKHANLLDVHPLVSFV